MIAAAQPGPGGREDVEAGQDAVEGEVTGPAGDPFQGIVVGLPALTGDDGAEVVEDARQGNTGEVEALAAGQDGDRDLVDLGGGEDELDVGGRLFKGLEEGVEGLLGEHVD